MLSFFEEHPKASTQYLSRKNSNIFEKAGEGWEKLTLGFIWKALWNSETIFLHSLFLPCFMLCINCLKLLTAFSTQTYFSSFFVKVIYSVSCVFAFWGRQENVKLLSNIFLSFHFSYSTPAPMHTLKHVRMWLEAKGSGWVEVNYEITFRFLFA